MAGDRHTDRYALGHSVVTLLEDELAAEGYELLDVRVFRGGGRDQVRVYLDASDGMDLAACAGASRTIAALLEEADIFPGAYVLEVSSPGIRRPLRTTAHFQAAVGQDIELTLRGERGTKRLRGRLRAVEADELVLAEKCQERSQEAEGSADGEVQRVQRRSVLEANLETEFDAQALIGADRRRRKAEKRQRRQERRRQLGNRSPADRSTD